MLMNRIETAAINSPLRRGLHRYYDVPLLARLGGRVAGGRALEAGCGSGEGTRLILDKLAAAQVDALDRVRGGPRPQGARPATRRLRGAHMRACAAQGSHRCLSGDNGALGGIGVAAGGGVRGFGDLEAAIMERVWAAGRPLLVREIQQALEPQRAYNTVWTVVEILSRKGWLTRERDGRAYRYVATVSREDYTAGLMGEALAASTDRAATLRLFAERIEPAEAEQLRRALERARRAGGPA